MRGFRYSTVVVFAYLFLHTASPIEAAPIVSHVYVTAYCTTDLPGGPVVDSGVPTVTLYDQRSVGRTPWKQIKPLVDVLGRMNGAVRFMFDAAPGNYDSFIKFPSFGCGRNGPLVVVEGHDRHLFIAGNAIMDWHARLALAGSIPSDGLSVKAVTLDRPANCGDDPREYNDLDSDGLTDDGYYYANVMAYAKQDHTIALMLSGALFTAGAILLTQPLGGPSHGRDLVIKNITPEILRAVAAAPNKFTCVAGF
jgi:hypothetical protein